MVEVKIGDVISLENAKKGNSDRGPWMLIPVQGEKGGRITIWCANPGDIDKFDGSVKILTMNDAKVTSRKVGDKWYSDFSVRCTLAQADKADDEVYTIDEIAADDAEELPF